MAGYKYYTILTDVGKQKLAEAIANETALDFTEMAVGDSNGTSYDPTSDMTALKHVTYRAAIGSMKINTEDKNVMEFEFIVPASTGGFYIREAGLYSSDGTLIAISRLPEQYKADMAEGAGSSMTVRILVAISSDAQIYITVPASITYATKTYVVEEFKKHKADSNPHEQYVLNKIYSDKIDELQKGINSKAAASHTHDNYFDKTKDILNKERGGLGKPLLTTDATGITYIEVPRKTNLNSIIKSGMYKCYEWVNYPSSANYQGQGFLHNFNWNESGNGTQVGYGCQYYINPISEVWKRVRVSTTFGPWLLIERKEGTVPSNAVEPIKCYTTSHGYWAETKLDNSKTLLEGWGVIATINAEENFTIFLPKVCISIYSVSEIQNLTSYGIVALSSTADIVKTNAYCNQNNNFVIRALNDIPGSPVDISWYFRGLIA